MITNTNYDVLITPDLPTNIMDCGRLDSSIILRLRGGIPRPIEKFPESLSQAILVTNDITTTTTNHHDNINIRNDDNHFHNKDSSNNHDNDNNNHHHVYNYNTNNNCNDNNDSRDNVSREIGPS